MLPTVSTACMGAARSHLTRSYISAHTHEYQWVCRLHSSPCSWNGQCMCMDDVLFMRAHDQHQQPHPELVSHSRGQQCLRCHPSAAAQQTAAVMPADTCGRPRGRRARSVSTSWRSMSWMCGSGHSLRWDTNLVQLVMPASMPTGMHMPDSSDRGHADTHALGCRLCRGAHKTGQE